VPCEHGTDTGEHPRPVDVTIDGLMRSRRPCRHTLSPPCP
jgi:hypothetical protein